MSRDPYKLYPHDYVLKYTLLLFIPRFVTPNHVTILRFLCIPFVAWLLLIGNYDIGIPAFIAVAFTDAIDGTLARVRKQVTDWGTFYDPVADKILISTAVIIIVVQHISLPFGLLIIFFELLTVIGGIIRKRRGLVTSANIWGKVKMLLQVIGVVFLMVAVWSGVDLFIPFSVGTLSLAIVFAIISLYTYGL